MHPGKEQYIEDLAAAYSGPSRLLNDPLQIHDLLALFEE
jgi:hypothetical protein